MKPLKDEVIKRIVNKAITPELIEDLNFGGTCDDFGKILKKHNVSEVMFLAYIDEIKKDLTIFDFDFGGHDVHIKNFFTVLVQGDESLFYEMKAKELAKVEEDRLPRWSSKFLSYLDNMYKEFETAVGIMLFVYKG